MEKEKRACCCGPFSRPPHFHKEKRACCCWPFSRPPHFHDPTCNGQRKTRLAAGGLFQGHHIFTIRLVREKEKRACCCGPFSRPPYFHKEKRACCCWPFSRPPHFHDQPQRKTRLAAGGLFQGHHIFTIRLVMAKEKRACCCQPFSRPPHFNDQPCNGQIKTGLLLGAFFKATTFSRSDL